MTTAKINDRIQDCSSLLFGECQEYQEVTCYYNDIPAPQSSTYTVAKGDSLYKIAQRFNVSVASLLAGNEDLTKNKKYRNGNLILVGMTLNVGGTSVEESATATLSKKNIADSTKARTGRKKMAKDFDAKDPIFSESPTPAFTGYLPLNIPNVTFSGAMSTFNVDIPMPEEVKVNFEGLTKTPADNNSATKVITPEIKAHAKRSAQLQSALMINDIYQKMVEEFREETTKAREQLKYSQNTNPIQAL